MSRTLKTLLVVASLVSFVVLLGVFNATKPRILVLHSGAKDSPWVSQMDRGMRAALEANRRPVSVEWLYMDAFGPAAARRTGQVQAEARRAIARTDPAVVIAVDDEANELVAREYVGRTDPRILYVSLDRPPADYGYAGAPNVSGIAERLPFGAVADAIAALFPGAAPAVSILGVDGVTGRAELAQALAHDWGPLRVDRSALAATAGQWRDFVAAVPASGVLVVLSGQDLPEADGTLFTAAQAAQWTERSSAALPIGTQVDFVAGGGALSLAPPPDDYGVQAITLALDWLDQRRTPGPPPPETSGHFEVALRPAALAECGLSLPPVYIEAARENATLFG
jgi:hypothetical protein